MPQFKPCLGKTACRDDGLTCLACGRSLEEIQRTQALIGGLVDVAIRYGYDNPQDFADYVARRMVKRLAHRRGEPGDDA